MKIPCEDCPVLIMCRHRFSCYCDLLYYSLRKNIGVGLSLAELSRVFKFEVTRVSKVHVHHKKMTSIFMNFLERGPLRIVREGIED